MRRQTKRTGVPDLHFAMIISALAVTILGAIGYLVAPETKSGFFSMMSVSAMTFLFGKFTNSFGRAFVPAGAIVPGADQEAAPDTNDDNPPSTPARAGKD